MEDLRGLVHILLQILGKMSTFTFAEPFGTLFIFSNLRNEFPVYVFLSALHVLLQKTLKKTDNMTIFTYYCK